MTRLQEAKAVDLVWYLSQNGYKPVREHSGTASYLSPFRDESNASFVVNKDSNRWVDFGVDDKSHDIIDLVEILSTCTTSRAIDILVGGETLPVFHREVDTERRRVNLDILNVDEDVTNEALIYYMESIRKIPIDIVNRYCNEVTFQFPTSAYARHYGVGIKNDLGGYTLRNSWFRGTSSPAGITTIHYEESLECDLYEGFNDFLSSVVLNGEPKNLSIILNSLVFIPMIIDFLRGFDKTNLYIDADAAANEKVIYLLSQGIPINDCRDVFDGYKDYNAYLQANFDF